MMLMCRLLAIAKFLVSLTRNLAIAKFQQSAHQHHAGVVSTRILINFCCCYLLVLDLLVELHSVCLKLYIQTAGHFCVLAVLCVL